MKIDKEVSIIKIADMIYVQGKLGVHKARIPGVTINGDIINTTEKRGLDTIKKMIEGTTKGFRSKRKINGVGYKGVVEESKIILSVGYKDDKFIDFPKTVSIKVEGNQIIGRSDMKEELAQIMSRIEEVRPGRKDRYKGKGIIKKSA